MTQELQRKDAEYGEKVVALTHSLLDIENYIDAGPVHCGESRVKYVATLD